MKFETILFDLDGTLVDPKIGFIRSVLHALAHLEITEENPDSLESFIGPPLNDFFRDIYALSTERCNLAVSLYRDYFSKRGMYECAVYPGIPEMLDELHGRGKRLIIATTKPTVFADKIITHFGLRGFFSGLFGSNLDGSRTDKGEIIAHVFKEMGVHNTTSAVMVGDRKYDIEGARKNGIRSVAVGYGYGTPGELQAAKPGVLVETVTELHQLLSG